MIHREWAAQRVDAAFLSRALPLDAYWTAIDIGGSSSRAAGAMRKARGVRAGIPDFFCLWRGIACWIERKAGTGLSVAQELTRDRLRANGHHWALARSTEDIEAALLAAGIPLRATVAGIRARVEDQNERLPAKKKRAARPRAVNGMTLAAYHKLHSRGLL